MVHNGIEYADMQMIAEVYGVMRDGLGLFDHAADIEALAASVPDSLKLYEFIAPAQQASPPRAQAPQPAGSPSRAASQASMLARWERRISSSMARA